MIGKLQRALVEHEPADFLRLVLDETGYMDMLKDRNTPDDVARIENLEELTRAVAESMDAGEDVHRFSGCGGAGERCRFVRRQAWRYVDHPAQHQGIGIRSRVF